MVGDPIPNSFTYHDFLLEMAGCVEQLIATKLNNNDSMLVFGHEKLR